MLRSLVGSEMCIRDRPEPACVRLGREEHHVAHTPPNSPVGDRHSPGGPNRIPAPTLARIQEWGQPRHRRACQHEPDPCHSVRPPPPCHKVPMACPGLDELDCRGVVPHPALLHLSLIHI
eukprot:TRINITY_DN51213_c0_g1_i1.p1 TRINITY_DN51213_c0_g1~~TRINITY_DN51213_c0_g1_i1.p1  ORF type:complete len:133 (-),score=14.35 TRINITY_DN51213_c0_g1_i1:65-424(-)